MLSQIKQDYLPIMATKESSKVFNQNPFAKKRLSRMSAVNLEFGRTVKSSCISENPFPLKKSISLKVNRKYLNNTCEHRESGLHKTKSFVSNYNVIPNRTCNNNSKNTMFKRKKKWENIAEDRYQIKASVDNLAPPSISRHKNNHSHSLNSGKSISTFGTSQILDTGSRSKSPCKSPNPHLPTKGVVRVNSFNKIKKVNKKTVRSNVIYLRSARSKTSGIIYYGTPLSRSAGTPLSRFAGTLLFRRDSAKPFRRDSAKAFRRDSAKAFRRDSAKPFRRDSAKPFRRDSAKPFRRDSTISALKALRRDSAKAYKYTIPDVFDLDERKYMTFDLNKNQVLQSENRLELDKLSPAEEQPCSKIITSIEEPPSQVMMYPLETILNVSTTTTRSDFKVLNDNIGSQTQNDGTVRFSPTDSRSYYLPSADYDCNKFRIDNWVEDCDPKNWISGTVSPFDDNNMRCFRTSKLNNSSTKVLNKGKNAFKTFNTTCTEPVNNSFPNKYEPYDTSNVNVDSCCNYQTIVSPYNNNPEHTCTSNLGISRKNKHHTNYTLPAPTAKKDDNEIKGRHHEKLSME